MTKLVNNVGNPINRTKVDPFGIQQNSENYYKPYYLNPARMSSYALQFQLALETECHSYLNIGSANNILSLLLSKQEKFVVDLDLDFHTRPNVVATFPKLPFYNNAFDVVLCYQMLEHLPFYLFTNHLNEIKRVTKSYIILSLPDITRSKRQKIKYLIYKKFKHPREWKFYKPRKINKEHFWEIGYEEINLYTLIDIFNKENLVLKKHYRNKLNRYHHFFVLKV